MLDSPAPEDEENIIFALKQVDCVCSISLTVTNSLLENLTAITEPLSELEDLVLFSRDNMRLTLPTTFRWGPRLRTLHSTGLPFLQSCSYFYLPRSCGYSAPRNS